VTRAKLTQGTISAGLMGLVLPMILGITSNLVAALFETYLLGLVGTNELAAYSFTFAVTGALGSLSLGISIGLSSVLARTVGGGDHGKVRRLTTDGMGLLALVMIVTSTIGYFSIEPLFRMMGADEDTLPHIVGYMQVWYLALVFFSLPSMGANALRAMGDARISGTIMVSGAALQAILDPIFIFGWFGLPAMGLEGAAWAVFTSRFILCIVTFYVLIYQEDLIDFGKRNIEGVMHSWRSILAVGLPATATNLIGPISTAIIVSLLAGYGKEAVAGFGIASRVEALSVIPLFALSASIGPFVGQNSGAKEYLRANQGMLIAFLWSMLWGFVIALLFWIFSDNIGGWFDDDPLVTDYTRLYLMIVPFSYGTWGVLMMASATFNSLGRPLISTSMSIVRMFVIYVPLAYIGESLWGVAGIFAAACVSNIVMGAIGFIMNRWTYGGGMSNWLGVGEYSLPESKAVKSN
jgi:putative MATE family efflux protein